MEFSLSLSEREAQQVLDALVKEPYIEVVDVVKNIQRQAVEQRRDTEEVSENEGNY